MNWLEVYKKDPITDDSHSSTDSQSPDVVTGERKKGGGCGCSLGPGGANMLGTAYDSESAWFDRTHGRDRLPHTPKEPQDTFNILGCSKGKDVFVWLVKGTGVGWSFISQARADAEAIMNCKADVVQGIAKRGGVRAYNCGTCWVMSPFGGTEAKVPCTKVIANLRPGPLSVACQVIDRPRAKYLFIAVAAGAFSGTAAIECKC